MEVVLKQEQTTLCALSFSKSIQLVNSSEETPAGCAAAIVNDKCTVYILLKVILAFVCCFYETQ
jgi:hypothetical protein